MDDPGEIKIMKTPIQQKIDATFTKKFIRHQTIGKFIYKNKWIRRVLTRVLGTLQSMNNDFIRREKYETFGPIRQSADVTKHGYTRKYGDLEYALEYAAEIAAPDFDEGSLGESYGLYQEQLKILREMIKEKKPRKVFNFGICYAYVDNELALEFPDVEFIGIDLSVHNKAFSDVDFGDTKNLTILTGDVFAHFSETDYSDCVFLTSRTLPLLPREFIEKLYKSASEANFRYLVGFEQSGLSEEILAPFVFESPDKPSVYWRDRMYIHNYPYLIESAGYEILDMALFTTNHTSADLQFLRFLAERK